MTRFWLTLDEAVDLVINGLKHMQGGEIFVPKIPSMKLVDLAEAVAPNCKIESIGIRPGEKLHEGLLTEEEGRNTIDYNGMYIIMPNYPWWKQENYSDGIKLTDNFHYSSNNNQKWLSLDDLRNITKETPNLQSELFSEFLASIHKISEDTIHAALNN